MAYNDDCKKNVWQKEVRESASAIDRLMEHGKEELVYTIMKGECYDDLEELIRHTLRMKSLLLKAEETFSTNIEEEIEEKEQHEEVMSTLNCIHSKICTVDNYVNGRLRETMEAVNMEVKEVRKSTNTIVEGIAEKEQTESEDNPQNLLKPMLVKAAKDKRYNVMVFLPGGSESSSYSGQIGDMLTYLGCDKEAMVGIEVVRDSGDVDKKTVLRVQMDSIEQASKILANAHKLKNYEENLYIAKDLKFSERIKLRELVSILRQKICEDPSHRWKIIDWQVVKIGLFKSCKKKIGYEKYDKWVMKPLSWDD